MNAKTAPQGVNIASEFTVKGIVVGSRKMLERFINAVAVNRLRPAIDRIFPFDAAPEAYAYLKAGRHVGKVVIRNDGMA